MSAAQYFATLSKAAQAEVSWLIAYELGTTSDERLEALQHYHALESHELRFCDAAQLATDCARFNR